LSYLGDGDDSEASVDAKSIMLFNIVKANTSFPLVDLVHLSNSKFLGTFNLKHRDDLENPYYAAGHVYAGSSQDTLLCQVYFNPFIINVLEQLISGRIFCCKVKQVNFQENSQV
jgi:hypothetical protein